MKEYIVVDLEMTGLRPARDKILEIGAAHMKEGREVRIFQTLVDPMVTLTEEVQEITGITQEMADGGLDTRIAVGLFLRFAGNLPLVGHNVIYDYSFLKQNAVNFGFSMESEALDTLKLCRTLLTEPEKKDLDSLCSYFSIGREKKHRALDDARATAELFELLKGRYGAERPELFVPKPLSYKAKKQGPITQRQKKYLKELVDYHKIELTAALEGMTKSEASRLTDQILSQYGKIPGR